MICDPTSDWQCNKQRCACFLPTAFWTIIVSKSFCSTPSWHVHRASTTSAKHDSIASGCLQHPSQSSDLFLLDAGIELHLNHWYSQWCWFDLIWYAVQASPVWQDPSTEISAYESAAYTVDADLFINMLSDSFSDCSALKSWLLNAFDIGHLWGSILQFHPATKWVNCNLKWQNWMVGIFVAFGVQLLLVVVATVAFAKLCWAT